MTIPPFDPSQWLHVPEDPERLAREREQLARRRERRLGIGERVAQRQEERRLLDEAIMRSLRTGEAYQPYQPVTSQEYGGQIMRGLMTGEYETPQAFAVGMAAESAPGIEVLTGARDVYQGVTRGQPMLAGAGLLGMLPGVPPAGQAVRRIGREFGSATGRVARRAADLPISDAPISAVKLDDGSIIYDPTATIHAEVINNAGIDPARVVDGGWVRGGEYVEGSQAAAGIGEQARAAERVAQRRAARVEAMQEGTRPVAAPDPAVAPPMQWTPDELTAYGRQHGVSRDLGRVSEEYWVPDATGREVNIPGGLEGEWSYHDLLELKAQGIDPSDLPRDVHNRFQQKLMRTMQPDDLADEDVFRGLLLGMTSQNNPLTPNEFVMARMMPRNMDDINRLADMYRQGKSNKEIAAAYGVQAAAEGGLGVRGSQNYRYIAQMADRFRSNPKWFRKREAEGWDEFVERLATQQAGFGQKTGSFGAVWQNLMAADVSAIDRHMARILYDDLPLSQRRELQRQALESWNRGERLSVATEGVRKARKARSFPDMLKLKGGASHFDQMLQNFVTRESNPMFISRGKPNPDVPLHLMSEEWIGVRPKKAVVMGQPYREALRANRAKAREQGLSTFGSQWLEWDRQRGRFEPHAVMYPELWKLPRMTVDQLREPLAAHKELGYFRSPGRVEQTMNPMELAAWGTGGLLAGGAAARRRLLEEQKQRNEGG